MGVRHDLYVQREECRVGGLDNVGGVRHNVVLDEGSEGSGKESKSHDIMLLYTPAAANFLFCKYAILLLQRFDGSPTQHNLWTFHADKKTCCRYMTMLKSWSLLPHLCLPCFIAIAAYWFDPEDQSSGFNDQFFHTCAASLCCKIKNLKGQCYEISHTFLFMVEYWHTLTVCWSRFSI